MPERPDVLDHLDARMVALIGRAGPGQVTAVDATGHCECGFHEVRVLDRRHIAYPGGGSAPAEVGVLLLDLAAEPVGLHVRGRVDQGWIDRGRVDRGRVAEGWVVVEVEEARLHRAPAR